MPWPPYPIARPTGARGAKGSFMAVMDTAIKKKNPPASYTPRAPSTASTAIHFHRKHDIYDNIITNCDAIAPRTNSPWEGAESASKLSSRESICREMSQHGKKNTREDSQRKCIWSKQNSLKIERLVKFYMKC